jgi:hypothetical protein
LPYLFIFIVFLHEIYISEPKFIGYVLITSSLTVKVLLVFRQDCCCVVSHHYTWR